MIGFEVLGQQNNIIEFQKMLSRNFRHVDGVKGGGEQISTGKSRHLQYSVTTTKCGVPVCCTEHK